MSQIPTAPPKSQKNIDNERTLAAMLNGSFTTETVEMANKMKVVENVSNHKKVEGDIGNTYTTSSKSTEQILNELEMKPMVATPPQQPQQQYNTTQQLHEAPEKMPQQFNSITPTFTPTSTQGVSDDQINRLISGGAVKDNLNEMLQQPQQYHPQAPQQQYHPQAPQQQPQMLTEQVLTELRPRIKEMIKEEALNIILMEMFSKPRVKKVLLEILKENKK